MTLFIHAPNVHQGGGRTLLSSVLRQLDKNASCILDSRMYSEDQTLPFSVRFVSPKIIDRIKAEIHLLKAVKSTDTVLCFGNLPPLFKLKGDVKVFLQNRYMFGYHDLSNFSLHTRLRLMVERFWFKTRVRPEYQIIVQSLTMQRHLHYSLGLPSTVLPFVATLKDVSHQLAQATDKRGFDFVYVSSAEPHKNHAALIEAWVILAKKGVRPSLALTVSENAAPNVTALIERMTSLHGLNITNLGSIDHGEISLLYRSSNALIFPSKLESFGLPLLEASQYGLPVLAPELDYVRDIIDPVQTFDPESPTSIARAVLRHLNVKEERVPLVDARVFLEQIKGQGTK